MPTLPTPSIRFAWAHTLKFKIVAMAVVTGVLSALVTTQLVLVTTRSNIENMLMQGESDEVERTASLLGTKVDMLREALKAMGRQTSSEFWENPMAMREHLASKPSLNVLFDNVVAARPDGEMLAHVARGKISAELVNIADRAYFQQALKTDQAVISEPLVARLNKMPAAVIAVSTRTGDNRISGVVAGVVGLYSNNLFSEISRSDREDGSRVLIMDRKGTLLAHPDPARLLGQARDEQGLSEAFERWHAMGSPIDTTGSTRMGQGHLVAMAGIPDTDWTLVQLTPLSSALQPVAAAQATAWRAAGGIGLLVALLAGGLAWYLTRPISKLRARATQLLGDGSASAEGWPQDSGEVGQLALAFQRVVSQREQKQLETDALLTQLEAVMDHAEVGIALTRNGQFELVSRQFCQIFGHEKSKVLGQSTRLIHPSAEAYDALSARAHPAFMTHGAFNGEVELARHNGERFWANMRGRAVVPGDRSKGTIWTVEDITTSREHRERLAWTSSHDSLTGLANRAAFEELLQHATAHAASAPFCAMFIDLDHFKQVNDTGGHAAGDALLRDVARTLAAQVRQADTVARLGGDEFAILLGGCPLARALEVAEKLRTAVVAYRLDWEGQSYGVGASIGLVAVDGSYDNAADVLRAADAACYAAKRQGRNAVALFDPQAPLPSPPDA